MSSLLRQGSVPEIKADTRVSSYVEDGLGSLENSFVRTKTRNRLSKRSRTASWTTLALSLTKQSSSSSSNNVTLANTTPRGSIGSGSGSISHFGSPASTGSFGQSMSSAPCSPSSRGPRMSLFVDPLNSQQQKEFGGSCKARSTSEHNDMLNLNLDNLFSGKCYDPEPVDICDKYDNLSWKPVPINEQTVDVSDKNDVSLVNTSHEHQPFYHRELSRESACRMFEHFGAEPGLCVVRDSTRTPGHYTLTVWNGRAVVNYRIEFSVRNSQGHYLLSGTTPFRSIGEVLLFLLHNSHFFPTAPSMYIPRIPDEAKDILYSDLFVPEKVDLWQKARTNSNT